MGRPKKIKPPVDQTRFNNSLTDFVSEALGTAVSQASTAQANNRYAAVTLNRALISTMYQEHGIIQVLIDQPVDDAFRGGIQVVCPEMSADEVKELEAWVLEKDILLTYAQALKWARLFGGAGIIINAGQTMDKPFSIGSIKEKTPLAFYAVDRWELSYTPQGNAMIDALAVDKQEVPFNYYGHRLHRDNVIKIMGKIAPSLIRGQFSGWGVSEIEKILRSWNQYVKHQSVAFEILDESKVDVFKIEGFNGSVMTPQGATLTAQRIGLAAKLKNYQNALVIDKNDDYEAKVMSFSGLAEILTQIRIGLAADLRMPMTKLFGISAAGLSAGEEDIENYNAMIESEIRSKVKSGLTTMLEIGCQKLFNYVPEKINFNFHPLKVVSSQEDSLLKTENLNRVITTFNNGIITSEKAVELINLEKIFDIDLDENEAMDLEELSEIGADNLEETKSVGRTGRV